MVAIKSGLAIPYQPAVAVRLLACRIQGTHSTQQLSLPVSCTYMYAWYGCSPQKQRHNQSVHHCTSVCYSAPPLDTRGHLTGTAKVRQAGQVTWPCDLVSLARMLARLGRACTASFAIRNAQTLLSAFAQAMTHRDSLALGNRRGQQASCAHFSRCLSVSGVCVYVCVCVCVCLCRGKRTWGIIRRMLVTGCCRQRVRLLFL